MGLDMFFVVKGDEEKETFREPLYYFRKHSELHGWLMDRWLKENPDKSKNDFNCVFYEIDRRCIEDLKNYCEEPNKVKYKGFFWGESYPEDWVETKNECIPVLEKKISKLRWDEKIYYYPYW